MTRANVPAASDNAAYVRETSDWEPCEWKTLVRHRPTHSIFEIYPLPGKDPDTLFAFEDFRARLVHVCPGHLQPAPAEHTRLCWEAVLMGLHFLGLVRFVECHDAIAGANDGATASWDDEPLF